jgi:hypothetical protein
MVGSRCSSPGGHQGRGLRAAFVSFCEHAPSSSLSPAAGSAWRPPSAWAPTSEHCPDRQDRPAALPRAGNLSQPGPAVRVDGQTIRSPAPRQCERHVRGDQGVPAVSARERSCRCPRPQPAPRCRPRRLAGNSPHTLSKSGTTMISLGLAAGHPTLAANCLWPRTAIRTAAVRNLLRAEEPISDSRTPGIVADAAYEILRRNPCEQSGHALIDEEGPAAAGVTGLAGRPPRRRGPGPAAPLRPRRGSRAGPGHCRLRACTRDPRSHRR